MIVTNVQLHLDSNLFGNFPNWYRFQTANFDKCPTLYRFHTPILTSVLLHTGCKP